MEQPSIEITYDPTIKVRGITEELFKQQPEGKFVLKPFTIISKKVYKNFTDRSHAFNYLLKFLKKKSKEDNNVILKVFSEPRKTKKRISISIFIDILKDLNIALTLFYDLLRPFKFISCIKSLLDAEDIFNKIITKADKTKLKILALDRLFFLILAFSGIIIFHPQIISILDSTHSINPSLFFSSYYSANIVWIILFISYIFGALIIYRILKVDPLFVNEFFNIPFALKRILYTTEKFKKQNNKKVILIINFDIYSYYGKATTLNFIKHLLNSIKETKNISIFFHAQDIEFIISIKIGLEPTQFNLISFFLENKKNNEKIQIFDNSEFEEENFPLSYREYEWYKQREEFRAKNQKLELEKKEQLARLIQSAKLESMNITTSGVSHEIRNPLSIIQLVIENLRLEKNLTKETLAQDLDKIQTQISRILKLTETFQKYSTKKNLTTKSIDSLIANAIAFFEQRLISNKIEVNYDKPEEPIAEIQFPEELSIVIENLLSNSIEALIGNKDAKISIKLNSIHNRLDIVFSDNGHGIPQESIKEIFTPLYTTKGPGQGTGLGLWLCYTIVKDNLKGDIRVDSPPNGWTTFTISLPIGGDENV
ncbi:MAG TPA: HAMP domain-containing sensor histidine kinase [Leptospiraceae bacterium]|nr:HAMP domain-containing sensor histidine kinase [Leptospiraceae bacterium]